MQPNSPRVTRRRSQSQLDTDRPRHPCNKRGYDHLQQRGGTEAHESDRANRQYRAVCIQRRPAPWGQLLCQKWEKNSDPHGTKEKRQQRSPHWSSRIWRILLHVLALAIIVHLFIGQSTPKNVTASRILKGFKSLSPGARQRLPWVQRNKNL